jgi:hypothetical protein
VHAVFWFTLNGVTHFTLRLHLELLLFFLLFREFFLTLFEAVIRSCQGVLSVWDRKFTVAVTLTAYSELIESKLHRLQ